VSEDASLPAAETGENPRRGIAEARRVVIKIGSNALVGGEGRFAAIASDVAALIAAGKRVVVVSSGAIAVGLGRLGLKERPRDIAMLQAAAAAGQSGLMAAWEEAFAFHGLHVAQLLLTHADLADRDRYLNARAAIDALLGLAAVPIINENDSVAVEEIRFGDNDQLAAMVATLVGADLLVLLTDVAGVLDRGQARVSVVTSDVSVEELIMPPARASVGSGGMRSKIVAARGASRRGVVVVIGPASEPRVVVRIAEGEDLGTLFPPAGARLASRKHWIAYTLKPKGAVVVDQGAADALAAKRSLLPAGVLGVRGDFEPGDSVVVVDPSGLEIARGLVRYATRDVARLAGARTSEIEDRLGRNGGDEIIHRDDMVLGADR
jgi:glutamate 5-kinase